MRKGLLFFIVMALALLPGVSANYEIVGDSVQVDDTNVILLVTPHTLTSSGYQNITLINKLYSGDIDIAFGFNSDGAKPKSLDLYNPHYYNVTRSYACDYDFNYTSDYFWCYYNTEVNIGTNETPIWENQTTIVFEHSFENGNLTLKTAYWNETYFKEWWSIADIFDKVDYDFQGYDIWYVAKNVPVTAEQKYVTRLYLNIPPRLGGNSGKFYVAIKPSSETISQAISLGHFYYLDPWWNSTYNYRYEITNTSTLIPGIPYSVNDTGVNGTQIWTAYDSGCTGIQYVYSTESGPSGDLAIGNGTVECNWENSSSLTGNNPTSVYPSRIESWYHFDDTTAQDSTGNYDGTVVGNPALIAGQRGSAFSFDGVDTDDYIDIPEEQFEGLGADGSIIYWINIPATETADYFWAVMEATNSIWGEIGAADVTGAFLKSGGATVATLNMPYNYDIWSSVVVLWKPDSVLYHNATVAETAGSSFTAYTAYTSAAIGAGGGGGSIIQEAKVKFDGFAVFADNLSQDETNMLHWNAIGNLTSLGSEEIYEVSLNTPSDSTIFADDPTSVTFNCSAVTHLDLTNITLYGNWSGGWHANETVNVTGTYNSTTFTKNITPTGTYVWNCLAFNNISDSIWGVSNYTFFINKPPTITLNSPVDGYTTTNTSVILNATATDPEGNTLTYYLIWNGTIVDSNSNGQFNFTHDDIEKLNNWTVNVSDGVANVSTTTRNLTIDYTHVNLYELTTGTHITENLTIDLKTGNYSLIQSQNGNNVTFKNLDAYAGTQIIVDAANVSSSYFLTQLISNTYINGEDFNLYHISISDNFALNTLKLQDLIGTFRNARFQAWAYVGATFTKIFEDTFDVEYKVVAYFDRDTRYTLYVLNDIETRVIGFFKPGAHLDTKLITIGQVTFDPTTAVMFDYIVYDWNTTTDTITFSWADALAETSYVEFYVYNLTNYSQQIYFSNCTNSTLCSFSFTVPDVNKSYTSYFKAFGTRWGHSPYDQSKGHYMLSTDKRIDLGLPADKENWYWVFSLSLMIMASMMFKRKFAAIGGLLSMTMGAFFVLIGWLPLPMALLAVFVVIAAIHAVRSREK